MKADEIKVVNPATCRKCGDPLLGFAQSKAGKSMAVVGHVHPMVEQVTVKAGAPFEFHVCITYRTPRQIDETLAEIYYAGASADVRDMRLRTERDRIREALDAGKHPIYGRSIEEVERQIADVTAWIVRLDGWAKFYEAEFERRGGWLRYYLVTSSVGHVHREMTCSTCHPTTTFAWLVDLADCDEEKMVEAHGTQACTTCFPNAPTLPAWIEAQNRDDAEEARKCPGSGEYVGFADGRKYHVCERCGEVVAKTKNGNLRKHKPAVTISTGV